MINPAVDYGDEYAFGDIEYTIPTLTHNVRPVGYQGKSAKTKSACTIIGAINQIIRLFWLELTTEQTNKLYDEVVDYCTGYWYKIWEWWTTPTACNTVVKWWNEKGYSRYGKDQVFRVQMLHTNPRLLEALKKGHLVGYTKHIQFGKDQVDGYVFRQSYPNTTGHRLNLKWVEFTVATGWAAKQDSKYGSQDNYHWAVGENFYIKDIATYINKGVYGNFYLILPVSYMWSSIEEEKTKLAHMKAVNATIWVMTSTWGDLEKKYQDLSANYAKELRNDYKDARPLYKDQEHKVYQSLVDFLSYCWKYAKPDEQEKYAELAKLLRDRYDLQ